jgi:hypothetical protein
MTTTLAPITTTKAVKDYFRIETDREDDLIADLIAEASGTIESVVGKSLTTESVTWIDNGTSFRTYGAPRSLILGYVPIDASTVVVKDNSSIVVPAANYLVRQDLQQIVGVSGNPVWNDTTIFGAGPYAITCTAGFGTSPTYATREQPYIRGGIIRYVGFLYYQRTPGAKSEGAAGSRVDYEIDSDTGLPCFLSSFIRKLRGPVITR